MFDCLVRFWDCGIWVVMWSLAMLTLGAGIAYLVGYHLGRYDELMRWQRLDRQRQRFDPWEQEAAG